MLAIQGDWREPWDYDASAYRRSCAVLCLVPAFKYRYPVLGSGGRVCDGYLFWIVSPTPQGIGVVEGVMTLCLPRWSAAAIAPTVSLAFRRIGFLAANVDRFHNFEVGRARLGEEKSLSESWNVDHRIMTVRLGVNQCAIGHYAAWRNGWPVWRRYSPYSCGWWAPYGCACPVFALICGRRAVRRTISVAWLATLGILIISAISHLIQRVDYEVALYSGVWSQGWFNFRHYFHAARTAICPGKA